MHKIIEKSRSVIAKVCYVLVNIFEAIGFVIIVLLGLFALMLIFYGIVWIIYGFIDM